MYRPALEMEIAIVLAVYNGRDLLNQQFESIILQDHKKWSLYARDDGSNDGSQMIVEAHSKQDRRIHLLVDDKGNLGVQGNFSSLMVTCELSAYQYIAFSDQDDVWRLDKLSHQLNVMREMERQFPAMPILVHSDMAVVDTSLDMISPSFMQYMGIQNEDKEPMRVLLAQNFVTGCTVLVNRRLLDIALPIPDDALMHDWWLALCAAVFGHIDFIDKPLVKYRQHGDNEVGAKPLSDFLDPTDGKWKKRWLEGRENLFRSMKQAGALAERIQKHDPTNHHLELVEAYASLEGLSPLQRVKRINQLGVRAQSKMRQILLLSRLLLTPRIQKD